MRNFVSLISLLFLFTSCSELTGSSTGANEFSLESLIGGVSFIEISDGKKRLEGTSEVKGTNSFRLNFNLPDGRSLKYFFFADLDLDGGIEASFTRDGEDVEFTLAINGESHTTTLKNLDTEIDVVIDIHNDHSDTHVLLWHSAGPYGDEESCVEDDTCLYNTEYFSFVNDGPWGGQGNTPGTFWGVQGDNVLVKELEGPLDAISAK